MTRCVAFAATADPVEDLLAVAAVHPLRADAALAVIARAGADRSVLDARVTEGYLRTIDFEGHTLYIRCNSRARKS